MCKRDTSDIDLQGIAAGESFTITETMDEGGDGGRHNFDLVGKLFYPRGIRPVGGLAAAAKAKMKAVRSARGGTKVCVGCIGVGYEVPIPWMGTV